MRPRKPSREPEPEPPKSEKLRRLGTLLATGMTGAKAAAAAGYANTSTVKKGVTAARAKKHPWVRWQIEQGRKVLAETSFAAVFHVRVALGLQKPRPGMTKDRLTLKDAAEHALSRHWLQSAGLLAPDTAPPPTSAALADAILGTVPPEKLSALLVRAAADARERHAAATKDAAE